LAQACDGVCHSCVTLQWCFLHGNAGAAAMVLSPALVSYAENIWRRFPEAFIALGLPQLEDLFELNEGAWCYRVVDTRAEKVVEIVLPRRKTKDSPEDLCESEDAENHPPSRATTQAPLVGKERPPRGNSRSSFGGELAARVGKLGLDVSNLRKSVKDCVSREIQAQLREVQPRNHRARLGHAEFLEAQGRLAQEGPPLRGRTQDSLRNRTATSSSSPGPVEEGEGPDHYLCGSPTESVVSWTSSLAARRGVALSLNPMDTSNLPRGAGLGSVKRAPLLDRSFAPRAVEDMGREQMNQAVQLSCGEATSPGAELQRRARRRKAAARGEPAAALSTQTSGSHRV